MSGDKQEPGRTGASGFKSVSAFLYPPAPDTFSLRPRGAAGQESRQHATDAENILFHNDGLRFFHRKEGQGPLDADGQPKNSLLVPESFGQYRLFMPVVFSYGHLHII